MEPLQSLALAAGLAWASGVRMYAAVFIVGLIGRLGYVHLPEHLQVLEHNGVLIASGIMLFAEFLADKVPGFDSAWDSIHTFIRIPIGAMLAWGAMSDAGADAQIVAAILGGAITGGTHLAKMSTRAAINISPEPFTNWTASFGEEGAVLAGLWLVFATRSCSSCCLCCSLPSSRGSCRSCCAFCVASGAGSKASARRRPR